MSTLDDKLRAYREERAADDAWDSEFTPSPYSPFAKIDEVADDPGGPGALLELLRTGDETDRYHACVGLSRCAARCGPEHLRALEEAAKVDRTARVAISALEAIAPERFFELGLHRTRLGVEAIAADKLQGPQGVAWLERILRESSEEAMVEALGVLERIQYRLTLGEPLRAVLRQAMRAHSRAVCGQATYFLARHVAHEPSDALIEGMALSGQVVPDRVAGDPSSALLVPVLVGQGQLHSLGELLERRRCAGLPNDPAPCRALLLERLTHPRESWPGPKGRDVGDAAKCALELRDPELLPVLVAAAGHFSDAALTAALRELGEPARAALERQHRESSGEVRKLTGWVLDAWARPRFATLDWGDRYFVDAKYDDFTGSAYTTYSEVLRAEPSAHAAFMLAWIDRAFGAPVVPSRVDWIRSLGFGDEALLAELGQRVERAFCGIRWHLRKCKPEEVERVLEAGLFGLAFTAAGDAQYKRLAEAHVARVRKACTRG